ncbi:hypothetical protein [Tuberibacillus calidus]|jgi:hypothetical protein|uniref:hypothetical protein n=1 Tax=Tuberibacillus calidus TaxID=340097 RepID=UPI000419CBB4|nr:hypothetical protein [Tuberibacillus calidus]
MSLQNKEQAIGYLLKSYMETELPASEMKKVNAIANDLLEAGKTYGNYEVQQLVYVIGERLKFNKELIEDWNSEIYYSFDMKTVEEAEEYYYHLKKAF